ncbi:MAG: transglycosylase SLT domain-containing protein [Prevotella sp.]|nr:transglycosylase SLT domain-containing protein [Prevotella sp.]
MNFKRHLILLATSVLIGGLTIPAQAQNDNEEKSITVTDDEGKQEEINLPQSMTMELDSLMQLYNAKMYLRPDSTCNMPDVNPVYEPDVYKERLSRLPTIIEMPYNSIVQAFIDRYTGDLRRSVAYMLGAQNFYMPVFEEALDAYGLPLELKYLPVIESALNPKIRSKAGAVGLWQFMMSTAKRYNLTINSLVDERRDIVKSSYAAAHYLSDLYKIYKDWNLVIAAYNCGTDKINKAIRRSHGERDYWRIYPRLPQETRGYVPAFIAANYVMNYYCDHNICPLSSDLPAKTDTVMVDRDIHFEQIAHVLNISIDELEDLNPQYRRGLVNGHSELSSLRLPASLISQFIDMEDSIYAFNAKDYKPKRSEVEVNDNATYLVKKNQVERVPAKPEQDKTTDSKSDNDNLQEKASSSRSRSKSSRSTSSRRSTKKSRSKKSKEQTKHVTVKSGDTLSEIAERNGTTVKKLRQLNGIKGSSIVTGKKIRVK